MAADHGSAAARDATRRRVSTQLEKTAMVRYAAERFITNAHRASSDATAADGAAAGATSGTSWNVHDGTWSGRAQAAAAHGLAVGDKLFRAYAPARFRLLRMGALILCVYLFGVFHFHWLWAVGVVALAVDAERLFVMHQVRTMVRTRLQEEEHTRRMGIMQKKMFPDHESAFWLNRVLQISWRGWLGCILTSTMHETVTPILKASMPGVVSDIGFERVDFGRNAPELGNLHMYDRVEENVAEFDFDLKLNSDLELILFAKVSKVKVPIRISDLELTARLRATISFIDDFPFAGNINLCLINRPYVDITVAPLKKLNVMGLPGVSSWLKEMVTDVLVDMLQWPNSFDVDLCNAMLGEPYDPNAVLMGKVTVGILHVRIIEARNLVAADTRRVGSKVLKLKPTSDPFCISRIHGHRRKTKTHKRTTNPKFDERYEFKVMNHKMRIFQMEVFDWDMHGKNDSLGTIDIDVNELVPNTGLDCWIDLKGAEHGEVHMELMYEEYEEIANTAATADDGDAKDSVPEKAEPTFESMLKSELTAFRSVRPSLSMGGGASGGAGGSGDSDRKGIVEVTVVRAEDLVAADRGGTSDPYVKLRLGTQQYKTAYKKKTLNPEWGEHFDFSIHNSATQVIELEVWDHDRLSDDLIGKYSLPISDIQEGRQELDVQLTGVPHGKLFLVVSRRSFKSPKKAKKTERKTPTPTDAAGSGSGAGAASPDADDAFAHAANAFSVAMGSASPSASPVNVAGDAPAVLALGRELSGTLTIKVKSARDLIAADRNGTSDPYTKIKLVSERGVTKVRTQVKKKTLTPVWNETFQIDVHDARHDIVRVEVMDYDRVGTNDSIGHAVIKLHEHVSAEHPELPLTAMEVPLRGVESGVVLLDVAFERPKDIVSAAPPQPAATPSEPTPPVAVAPPSPMAPGAGVLTDSDESGESGDDDAGAVSDALSNVSAPSSAAASPLRNKHLAAAAAGGARLKPHMSEVGFGVQSLGSGSDSDSSPDRSDMTRPASMMNLPAVRTPTQHALEKKKDSFVRSSKSKHRAGAIGVLQVVVKSARNLLAFNSGGTSDPYVVLNVNGHQESKTKKHSKTVAPLFNETCHFFIHNTDEVLTARVLNYNRFTADDVLGVMHYQTSGTNLDSETAFFTLQEVESGELELTITYYSLS